MTSKTNGGRIADMAALRDAASELTDEGMELAAQIVGLLADTKATRKKRKR